MANIMGTDFVWCLGVEDTFIPQTRPGLRALDEYEITAHYKYWKTDFDLLKELGGVTHLRWGIPWYKVNPAPGKFDWSWTDQALDYLVNECHVQPIVDLMHYGTPLWMDNSFINSSYAERNAEYAYAFAEHYKGLVRYFTPLNEPMVTADWCGRRGEWPPYLVGDDGYVKVLMPVAKGVALTAQAIREANSEAVLVQVEALEWHFTKDERLREHARLQLEHIFLPFDLFTGHVGSDHPLVPFLRQHGAREEQLLWLRDHAARVDVVGMNYYPFSGGEWVMGANDQPEMVRGVGLEELMAQYRFTYERYKLPVLLTETCDMGPLESRKRWMDGSIATTRQARASGLPVLGYTWWPLFEMIDWKYRTETGPLHKYRIKGGLWANSWRRLEDMRRKRTPLADLFQEYVLGKR